MGKPKLSRHHPQPPPSPSPSEPLTSPTTTVLPVLSDTVQPESQAVQLGVTPAIYDPVNYPEGAALADDYLKAHPASQTLTALRAEVLATNTLPADFKLPKKAFSLGGVFGQLEKYHTAAEKVAWLRHNDKPTLRYLLRVAFEPSVEWVLPKGLPPYKPFEVRRNGRVLPIKPGQTPTELQLELRRLYLFMKGGSDKMNQLRREKVFQEIIESIDPLEVDVLLSVKDKKFDKFVTVDVVNAAFPGLLLSPFHMRFMR